MTDHPIAILEKDHGGIQLKMVSLNMMRPGAPSGCFDRSAFVGQKMDELRAQKLQDIAEKGSEASVLGQAEEQAIFQQATQLANALEDDILAARKVQMLAVLQKLETEEQPDIYLLQESWIEDPCFNAFLSRLENFTVMGKGDGLAMLVRHDKIGSCSASVFSRSPRAIHTTLTLNNGVEITQYNIHAVHDRGPLQPRQEEVRGILQGGGSRKVRMMGDWNTPDSGPATQSVPAQFAGEHVSGVFAATDYGFACDPAPAGKTPVIKKLELRFVSAVRFLGLVPVAAEEKSSVAQAATPLQGYSARQQESLQEWKQIILIDDTQRDEIVFKGKSIVDYDKELVELLKVVGSGTREGTPLVHIGKASCFAAPGEVRYQLLLPIEIDEGVSDKWRDLKLAAL